MPPIFASFSASIKSYGLIRSLGGGAASVPPIFAQIFQSTNPWTVPTAVTSIDYLIVAGGGGGAKDGDGFYVSGVTSDYSNYKAPKASTGPAPSMRRGGSMKGKSC